MSFARAELLGNLGGDPEYKQTTNGDAMVSFSIAVNDLKDRDKTHWYRCTAYRDVAERLDRMVQAGHIAKGRSLYVAGRFQPRTYEDRNGNKQWSFDVTVDSWEFTGTGRESQQNDSRNTAPELDDVPF